MCCPVLQEERDSFGSEILGGAGLVDAWRAQHPGVVGYTYYSFRGPNGGMRVQGKGWRLDYTLVRSAQGRECAVLGGSVGVCCALGRAGGLCQDLAGCTLVFPAPSL